MKITIVWPPNADYFVAVHDGIEFELDRVVATADAAGEFKTVAETRGQQTMKALKESASTRKQTHKEAGTDIIVPGIDVPFVASGNQSLDAVAMMPRKKIETRPELLEAISPRQAA